MANQEAKAKNKKFEGFPTYIRIRCDDRIIQWVDELAKEAGRTRSDWLRDIIFFMKISYAGAMVNANLLNDGIHYRPQRPLKVSTETITFPWGIPTKDGWHIPENDSQE